MVEILRKVFKIYKKSIISSILVAVVMIGLIYASTLQGKFFWFDWKPQSTGYMVMPTGYIPMKTLSFSALWMILSLVIILSFLIFIFLKNR